MAEDEAEDFTEVLEEPFPAPPGAPSRRPWVCLPPLFLEEEGADGFLGELVGTDVVEAEFFATVADDYEPWGIPYAPSGGYACDGAVVYAAPFDVWEVVSDEGVVVGCVEGFVGILG